MNADSLLESEPSMAIKLQPRTMVRNSASPSCRWLDWNASANAAPILASRSDPDFDGTESASLSACTASMRCDIASSATLALDTASRCDAASAKIEWMRYSYCSSQRKRPGTRICGFWGWCCIQVGGFATPPLLHAITRELGQRTLCAKLGITVIQILSPPTGK